jgi:hypothetical protein
MRHPADLALTSGLGGAVMGTTGALLMVIAHLDVPVLVTLAMVAIASQGATLASAVGLYRLNHFMLKPGCPNILRYIMAGLPQYLALHHGVAPVGDGYPGGSGKPVRLRLGDTLGCQHPDGHGQRPVDGDALFRQLRSAAAPAAACAAACQADTNSRCRNGP